MQDNIALLTTLILPFGAASGQRVVLDGDSGLISIFDNSDQERLRLGGTGSDRILLFTGDASENQGADIGAFVIGSGNTRQLAIVTDAPQFSGLSFATIVETSESFDGTVPCDIELAADLIKFTGINVTPDLQVDGVSLPRGLVNGIAQSTAATTAVTTTETKDDGVGDYAFTVKTGHFYRVTYQCRARSSAAGDKIDVRIRDGGASSPTNTSTLRAGGEVGVNTTTGDQLIVTQMLSGLAAGTHTLAAFYVRAAGTGNVNVDQATGQTRELYVEDLGT